MKWVYCNVALLLCTGIRVANARLASYEFDIPASKESARSVVPDGSNQRHHLSTVPPIRPVVPEHGPKQGVPHSEQPTSLHWLHHQVKQTPSRTQSTNNGWKDYVNKHQPQYSRSFAMPNAPHSRVPRAAQETLNDSPLSPLTRSYKESNEPDPFLGVQYFSGYIPVGQPGGDMFYWYFPHAPINKSTEPTATSNKGPVRQEKDDSGYDNVIGTNRNSDNEAGFFFLQDNTDSTIPFLVWLTGGPGCSSELAALTENGPFTIQSGPRVVTNPYSWHSVSHIVYVDQPLGTGFSTVGDPRNLATNEISIAANVREFLYKFVNRYPHLKDRPFYLSGESYAGHYIPAIAHALIRVPVVGLNLKGILIGNGWVDPQEQYPAYADFAYTHNLIGDVAYQLSKKALSDCVELIKKELWLVALMQCNTIVSGLLGKRNPYDIRLMCDSPPTCYNTTDLTNFLNKDEVQRNLGVHKKWVECSTLVYTMLLGDWETDLKDRVEEILNSGLKVLVYNGDQDFICNWMGGEAWVNKLKWEHAEAFAATPYQPWNVEGKAAGEVRSAGNLTFVRVYNAGHMVPMDAPVAALDLVKRFLLDQPFTMEPHAPLPSESLEAPEGQVKAFGFIPADLHINNQMVVAYE